jgi:putative membrane protein
MQYFYIKALHIIFVVTWFAGLFYMVRLFIYTAEANAKPEPERSILLKQLLLMQNRLWYIITWPSAVLTFIFGGWLWYMLGSFPGWLMVKVGFVLGLFLYHLSLQVIYKQQTKNIFKYSSQQLRIWNEVATLFLVIIVMLATVKQMLSALWATGIMIALAVVLMIAIKLYKKYRKD